jgi:hypothetical protein
MRGADVPGTPIHGRWVRITQESLPWSIGVDLRDVEAVNLRLADVAAAGTGVRVEKGKFSGDIDIKGVRAGVPPGGPAKDG